MKDGILYEKGILGQRSFLGRAGDESGILTTLRTERTFGVLFICKTEVGLYLHGLENSGFSWNRRERRS